ncbi:hypothetical protein BKA65DRAFT_493125 [Rhexocercosporidium sp. MPI-PUGE-AT-0058]|nr:hypothetical protein BKA65DRAFT_493125 [Rhexocercosporidium sp. MPI-PUGE-AT-0058]
MDPAPATQVPILRQIFNLFGFGFARHHTQGRSITFDLDSPIKRLPPELMLLIVDYGSVVSGASLSLTCHSFYICLRERCLDSLKKAGHSTIHEFLSCLERDLPTHVACPYCVQLHPISIAEKYHPLSRTDSRPNRPWLACCHMELTSGLAKGTYVEFSSIIFHMAMKAYRQSRETTQLLRLLSCETKKLLDWGFVEQRTAEARIQDGSLLLREQRVFMVPSSEAIPLPWCGGINICPHIRFVTMRTLHVYGIQIPCASQIENFENRQGLICCNHCYTEFRVDFKSYGKAGNAMFLTRWMDLGEGRNFNDHKFRSRLSGIGETSWAKVAFPRGSICASFEQKPEAAFKFDSLLSHQDEKDMCTEIISWPWPEGKKVSFIGVKQYYMVRNGSFVFLPSEQGAIS